MAFVMVGTTNVAHSSPARSRNLQTIALRAQFAFHQADMILLMRFSEIKSFLRSKSLEIKTGSGLPQS